MNAIAQATGREAALAPPFVEAEGDLGTMVRAVQRGVSPGPIVPELLAATRAHLARAERHAAPSTERLMLAWLVRLASGVLNAPTSRPDIERSAGAFWDVCYDLPAGVWTDDARREWVRGEQGKFWPAPKELFDHLSITARRIRTEVSACRAIIDAATRPTGEFVRPPRDEREKILDRFHAQLAEIQAERNDQVEQPRLTPAQSTVMPSTSRDSLVAIWTHAHAKRVPGADLRLRALGVEL